MCQVELTKYQIKFLLNSLSPYFNDGESDSDFVLNLVKTLLTDI